MASPDAESTPFVKQLAASDRRTREKALSLLTSYLTSGRTFSLPDLLKIWKGLFYTVHHTDRPVPQQQLARSLTNDLLLALSPHVFLPFLAAFWTTIIAYYSDIPSLRLDKYLYLVRMYVQGSFKYLLRPRRQQDGTSTTTEEGEAIMAGWCDLTTGKGEWEGKHCGVMDLSDKRVPDGLRYHVLDVWVDGLLDCDYDDGEQDNRLKMMMGLVEMVAQNGDTKVLRQRARAVLDDPRLSEETVARREGEDAHVVDGDHQEQDVDDGESFEGFGD